MSSVHNTNMPNTDNWAGNLHNLINKNHIMETSLKSLMFNSSLCAITFLATTKSKQQLSWTFGRKTKHEVDFYNIFKRHLPRILFFADSGSSLLIEK